MRRIPVTPLSPGRIQCHAVTAVILLPPGGGPAGHVRVLPPGRAAPSLPASPREGRRLHRPALTGRRRLNRCFPHPWCLATARGPARRRVPPRALLRVSSQRATHLSVALPPTASSSAPRPGTAALIRRDQPSAGWGRAHRPQLAPARHLSPPGLPFVDDQLNPLVMRVLAQHAGTGLVVGNAVLGRGRLATRTVPLAPEPARHLLVQRPFLLRRLCGSHRGGSRRRARDAVRRERSPRNPEDAARGRAEGGLGLQRRLLHTSGARLRPVRRAGAPPRRGARLVGEAGPRRTG
ncbi:hypothetical protein SAMN02787118_111264 [Streptomyces mirabilis]|uniref:Uncharacterized protein n=1 Tax=Streptomyces mirabilis TaxID=68239 RepID=A0A1I2LBT9_9ACTN|nr:hypothetical protein SAMN02787118_111264 [Streptomyces mirabilis]